LIYYLQKYQEACEDFLAYSGSSVSASLQLPEQSSTWFRPYLDRVKSISERYQNLQSTSNVLFDRQRNASRIYVDFVKLADSMEKWLKDASKTLKQLESAPATSDPVAQLAEVKRFITDTIVAGENQMDVLKQTSRSLSECLKELGSGDQAQDEISDRVGALQNQLEELVRAAGGLADRLQADIMKSSSELDRLYQLRDWIKGLENQFITMMPISLLEEKLNRQMHELLIMQSDVDSHTSSVHLVNTSMAELIRKSDDAVDRDAWKDELDEMNAGFQQIKNLCTQRRSEIDDVASKLAEFNSTVSRYDNWISATMTTLRSSAMMSLSTGAFRDKVAEVSDEAKEELADLVLIRKLARDLVETGGQTCDGSHITAAVLAANKKWEEFCDALGECEKEAAERERRLQRFETMKDTVVQWLQTMQTKIENFDPIAVDLAVVTDQMSSLEVRSLHLNVVEFPSFCTFQC
jgi:methyl-accepting chemotaxis protein